MLEEQTEVHQLVVALCVDHPISMFKALECYARGLLQDTITVAGSLHEHHHMMLPNTKKAHTIRVAANKQ